MDYVYTRAGEELEHVAGFDFTEGFRSEFGSIYAVKRIPGCEPVAKLVSKQ